VTAEGEVGKKGKEYGTGFITTPIAAYVTVREKIPMIQIEHGLKIYKAQNDRPPKDFAEFTQEILNPANITLPALNPGDSYFFDPKQGDHGVLMIRKKIVPKQ
jgi:hypothetical protein